jgi:hypothetical protein
MERRCAQEAPDRHDWAETTGYQAELKALYEASQNHPLWVRNGRVTDRALEAIEMLRDADAKGLNPADYDGPQWPGRLLTLVSN